MLLSPPGGLRTPPKYSLDSAFPSANILLPLISRNFAELSGFSADAGGASPLKIPFPESSENFWLGIFFAVLINDSSLEAPLACFKEERVQSSELRFLCSYVEEFRKPSYL